MKNLITICAVVGLIMTAAGTAQADLTTNGIYINSCKEHRNGTPETYPWVFETGRIGFVNPANLHHIDVTKPGASTPFTTIYEVDGGWEYESPSRYLTLAALQGDYPTGNYIFDFRDINDTLLNSITLDYSGISEPTEAVNFIYPSTIGQTGIDINPTFTWTVSPTAGNVLGMSVLDVLTDESVYESWGVPMTTTSWTPGPLLPNHEYELEVAVIGVRDGNPYDSFLSIQCDNGIEFTTAVLPSDNFNDNSMDTSLWNLYEDDHINAWLDETNARLEFRSTADADDVPALYIAGDWGFLPTADFSFRVDFHYSSTVTAGSVLLGIRKDEESGENEVWLEAGYEEAATPYSAFFWDASVDGSQFDDSAGEQSRSLDDGTLYISYNAATDDLYVSGSGYWADNAWGTISGLVQGEWDADRVSPLLGGCSGEMDGALPSGGAYLDNFVVDSGTIVFICEYALVGDLNNDCKVDFGDFVIMAANWLIDCNTNPSSPACVPK